jgi:DNA-binding CsgD family transcriptional regulator
MHPRASTDLLERRSQLEELQQLFRTADGEEGQLLFLGGEAGIGKSTLVDEFARQVSGHARVAIGSCDGLSTPGALGPILDVAPSLGIERTDLVGIGVTRETIHRRLLDALASDELPTVLIGEDAQWADEATLNLVRYLGRRIGRVRALLIVTYRDDELDAEHPLRVVMGDLASASWVSRMTLPRLSLAAVHHMARGHPADSAELFALTAGNPFFLTEVLAAEGRALPGGVRDAVLGRAARLSPEARDVLDAAATIGVRIEPELLRRVVREPIENPVEECLAVGVLESEGRLLAFRHAIAWQTIRSAVSSVRSRDLNRRILAAMLADPQMGADHARLALHAEEAGDADAALRHAVEAAEEAAALSAHREAAAQFGRALRFAGRLPMERRAELLERESLECYLSGLMARAIDARSSAITLWRQVGDGLREGDCLRWLSQLLWIDGQADEALARAKQSMAVLESLPEGPELAWAYATLSQLHMRAHHGAAAIDLGERAMALAEATGSTEPLVHALCTIGSVSADVGRRGGRALLERSLALARQAGYEDHVARALCNLVADAMLSDRQLAVADRYVSEGLSWCVERDLSGWEMDLLEMRCLVRFAQGDWAGALEDVESVLNATSSRSHRYAILVRCMIETLRGGDGSTSLQLFLDDSERAGELVRNVHTVESHLMRAEAAWLRGDRDAALRDASRGYEIARGRVEPSLEGDLALLLRRLGGQPEASDRLPDPDRVQLNGDWRLAADLWGERGYPLETARALMEGDEAAVREAWEIFDRLGAQPDAQLAVARLRELGVRRIPRGPRASTRANTAGLTSREIEVLRLLVDGKQDREIAQRLFLSPRTVGHHVSSILGKLGVTTRAAAAREATHQGILQIGDQARPS